MRKLDQLRGKLHVYGREAISADAIDWALKRIERLEAVLKATKLYNATIDAVLEEDP